jgi:hypothetical protein
MWLFRMTVLIGEMHKELTLKLGELPVRELKSIKKYMVSGDLLQVFAQFHILAGHQFHQTMHSLEFGYQQLGGVTTQLK